MLLWDDLRFFLALQRAGSLSAAARELKVNQTTVGRRIRALERALEARLFDRTDRGYVLAPSGEALLPRAEAAEAELHAAAMAISGRESGLAGSIRLTAPETFGSRFLVPVVARFMERHPEIEVELVAENRTLNLSQREADLSVRLSRPSALSLILRKVGELANGLYAAPGYLAKRPYRPARGLRGHDVVGFDETAERWPEARWLAERLDGARVRCRVNTTHAMLYAAESGAGIAVLPCYLGDASAGLTRVAGPAGLARQSIWLVVHRDLRPSARIRALLDFIAEEVAAARTRLSGLRREPGRPASRASARA